VSRKFFSLSVVARRIEELLQPALERTFWLKAEISSGRERRGAFYCDLVESDAAGEVVAQMRCTLWGRDLARIRSTFREAGLDLVLEDGTVVGLLCRLQYHPRYGLSLAGIDMDPAVALGELELRRRRILDTLTRDGLLERNAQRPVPLLPNRIALITSAASAAYEDFVGTLMRSPYGFRVCLADSVVQGAATERALLDALDVVERIPVDLVVIVRGGGSRTDLAHLDSEAVARRIADFRLPVWTGIGHETDTSILDHVAGSRFKTPTAVAEALVARFSSVEWDLGEAGRRLQARWRERLREQFDWLRRQQVGLKQGTRKLLDMRRSQLLAAAEAVRGRVSGRMAQERTRLGMRRAGFQAATEARLRELRRLRAEAWLRLRRGAREGLRAASLSLSQRRERFALRRVLRRIEDERRALTQRLQTLRAADPRTALARGFSLTYTSEGALVRSIEELRAGQTTLTRFIDGRVESRVEKISEEEDG
jgi:exodeoxyribonuclease VII large subunit